MVEQSWTLDTKLLTRIGLFIAASYAFYVGLQQWARATDALHPIIVALMLLTYIVAFVMLVSGATGVALKWVRHLIPVVFIFALLIQFAFRVQGQPKSYGTDSAAFVHYAAQLFLRGTNPYGQDMSPSLDEFRMPPTYRTSKINGDYELHLNNPAFGFLVYVPFIWSGFDDARVVLLVFHILLLILLYVSAPPWLKPFVLVPFFINQDMLLFTFGTVTDVVWAFFLTAAAILWKRRDTSALLFGLAISTKQQPWLLIPFLAIRLWQETENAPALVRGTVVARYLGIAEAVFIGVNAPFLLSTPAEWLNGTMAPLFGSMIMDGQGLSTLSQIGLLYVPQSFYMLAVLLVAAALVVVYSLHFQRLKHAVWLFPGIILWFSFRSFQSYFIYWIPPLMVSLLAVAHEQARHPDEMPERLAGVTGIVQRWRTLVSAAAVSAVLVFVAGGLLFYGLFGKPSLVLTIQRAVLDPQSNAIDRMELTVTNVSSETVYPVFWVKETGRTRFNWQIMQGPSLLVSGQQAPFTIQASFPEYQVPNGTVLSVEVNDAHTMNLSGFTTAKPIDLTTHASLLNPSYFYWTTDGGIEHPYGWGLYQVGVGKSGSATIANRQIAEQPCVALTATKTGSTSPEWTIGYLDQWIEFPDYKFRIPVYPTFRYAGGNSPSTVLGIEIRDDEHQLWYIFSDDPERLWTDPKNPNVAYRVINAPLNQWSDHLLDVPADYRALNWQLPVEKHVFENGQSLLKRMINFRLMIGSTEGKPATYGGCFGAIIQHLP